jgi:hypothetical protein
MRKDVIEGDQPKKKNEEKRKKKKKRENVEIVVRKETRKLVLR